MKGRGKIYHIEMTINDKSMYGKGIGRRLVVKIYRTMPRLLLEPIYK